MLMIQSKISKLNKNKLQKTDTQTIPMLITFGKKPFSFVFQVKYAKIGQIQEKTDQNFI